MPQGLCWPLSSEVAAFGAPPVQQMGQVGQAFGDQIADPVFALPAAFHGQQARAEQHLALAFAQVTPDDELDACRVLRSAVEGHFGEPSVPTQRFGGKRRQAPFAKSPDQ